MNLSWKACGNGRYTALASRIVGGKYFIQWKESYYSEQACEQVEVRRFDVHYQRKGSRGSSNIDQTSIRTLAKAKALAELHHAKMKALILEYGHRDAIPSQVRYQFGREMLDWQKLD